MVLRMVAETKKLRFMARACFILGLEVVTVQLFREMVWKRAHGLFHGSLA
jgi:hypothetical protein